MTSAQPEIPELMAIQPESRPMTSTTMTRSWDLAVECSRSRASVAVATAVSQPKVLWVACRSLSMVLGTPITGIPFSVAKRWAISRLPSPPTAMWQKKPMRW